LNSGLLLARQALYNLSHPSGIFALVVFWIESCIYAWTYLDCVPPIYASHIAGMSGMYHHSQLFFG
jgi:hypothetical protein